MINLPLRPIAFGLGFALLAAESSLAEPEVRPSPREVVEIGMNARRLAVLFQWMPEASEAEVIEFLELGAAQPPVWQTELRFAIARWVELDPAGARVFAERAEIERLFGKISSFPLRAFWTEWASVDPAAAAAAAPGAPVKKGEKPVPEFRSDPAETARQLLAAARPDKASRDALREAAASWAGKEPEEALDWAMAIHHEDLRKSAVEGAVRTMSVNAPEAMLEQLLEAPDASAYLGGAGRAVAGNHPMRAIAMAKAMQSGYTQHRFVQGVAGALSTSHPRQTVDLLEALGWEVSGDGPLEKALPKLARESPSEALRGAFRIHEGAIRRKVAAKIFGIWVESEPDAAVRFTEKLPTVPGLPEVAAGLGEALGDTDPQNLRPMPAFADLEVRKAYANGFAKSLAKGNPKGLVEWMKTIGADERRSAMFRNVDTMSWSAPAEACTAFGLLEPKHLDKFVINEIAPRWARRDPVATGEWMLALPVPDQDKISLAFGLVAQRYRDHDIEAARKWAERITGERARGSAQRAID